MKVLIDMIKLRAAMTENPSLELPEALFYNTVNTNGLKTIRELAAFRFTCRRCEDAPCISVCPVEALERDKDGVIMRHTNLCVSCKSCVTICPFGTMMTDFFKHHRNRDLLYNLRDDEQVKKFVAACPPGTAILTEGNEKPTEHIYKLNDKVLIREYIYTTEKE
ncbi:MAG TPA: 4Fe-4S dicluster domain-containing protein [Bacteroidales bacterium]|nr:4Fe-4S dicluster domain-containing protein [Bacteroidales bacterium]